MKCLSMKKISFIFLLAIVLSSFGVFCLCLPASAISLTSVGGTYFPASGAAFLSRHTSPDVSGFMSGNDLVFDLRQYLSSNNIQSADLTGLHWDLSTTIPPNSLVTMKLSYRIQSLSAQYYGTTFRGATILEDSCLNNPPGAMIYNGAQLTAIECQYTVLTNSAITSFDTTDETRIIRVALMSSYSNDPKWELYVSGGSYRQLSNDSLSADDREWLESVLPDSTTVGEVEQAIDNARESEKEEYEQQAQETEDTANDESSAAQGTATSLLSVVGQFIGVLTSAQPTNCNLNGNLIPHLPLGNLDLCQNSPPAAITVLGSLVLIAFVVPLAYHTVKRMLALIGSFQS